MKRAILVVNPELLVELLKGEWPRTFEVYDHALPLDAKVVDVRYINSRDEIAIELESETFNEVTGKSGPPVLSTPQCRIVLATPTEGDGST